MKSLFDLSSESRDAVAELLRQEGIDFSGSQSIRRREIRDHAALSYAQRRLWFLYEFEADKALYNIPTALRLKGRLQVGALEQAIGEIVRRHEALRTRIAELDGDAVQVIEEGVELEMPVVDLEKLPPGQRQQELDRRVKEEAERAFDLRRSPLLRALLLRLNEQEHVLVLTMHHIASDGWSLGIVARELGVLYEAYSQGKESPLEELPIQYADYAVWQREWLRGEVEQNQLQYWRKQLAELPASLELPLSRPRPPVANHEAAIHRFELSSELVKGLREFGRKHGVTQFMTLLAASQILLGRYSSETDIAVGTPIAGRTREETEELIGFFVNTLVMRTDLSGNPSFVELLGRVREAALGAYANQDIPFEKLVEEFQLPRARSRTPLFQVMFVLLNEMKANWTLSKLTVLEEQVELGREKFDLTVQFQECGDEIKGEISYRADLFDAAMIQRMAGHLQMVLRAMVGHAEKRIGELELLTASERGQILLEWNDTRRAYPGERCIHELFEAQAERSPNAVAIVFEGKEVTYQQLNQRANRLAHYLRKLGIKPDALVGVCVERSVEMVVGLLAILKAGAAYVPLDPNYPAARLAYMMEDAQVQVLLTQAILAKGRLQEVLDKSEAKRICLDDHEDWADIELQSSNNPKVSVGMENLAYMIYTSGSTGTPKGAMNRHGGIRNRLLWMQEAYGLQANDRVLQKTPFSFDVSVWEFFWPLITGAVLVVARPEAHRDSRYLAQVIAQEKITTVHFVPSMLEIFLQEPEAGQCFSLQRVICSGEALAPESSRKFFSQFNAELHNLYGPTEAAVDVTYWQCRREAAEMTVPIGKPIANVQMYVLDKELRPLPIGVAGEIYIAGEGLGRGYWRRPELTAEKFIPNPFGDREGQRMYRTEDRGRYRNDGSIEFLGRLDHQVKLRGFRIELGEIEYVIAQHPAVAQVAVIIHDEPAGLKQLVAYVVPLPGTGLTSADLLRHISERLPDYMVPAVIVELSELPLTANGKLDRKALPAPKQDSQADHRYEAPLGEVEIAVAAIWAEVLKLERVGRFDNFFDLGGHSLLAMQAITRLRKTLSVEITIGNLFALPVLADLARKLETSAAAELPAIRRAVRRARLPLSFAQQRLWFLAQMEGASEAYHIPWAFNLRGPLDRWALVLALDRIVERHEALRTVFTSLEGEPEQRIAGAEGSRFHLLEQNLQEEIDTHEALGRLVAEEATAFFDLEKGPLIRGRLISLGKEEHALLITMHHIVSDGWSMGVLAHELSQLYGAFVLGKPDPLPELEVQYADYALWQRRWMEGSILREQADYWKKTLAGVPALLELPTDRTRPAKQDYGGALVKVLFDEELTAGLRELSKRHGTTPYMTLMAGWATLLARLSGQNDIAIGTPVANRGRVEIENLIGFFVNTLVMRVDMSDSPTVGELLDRVKAQTLAGQQHQDIPFEQVVETVQPVRSMAHSPLFQVMFIWQSAGEPQLQLPGLEVAPLTAAPHAVAKFDLTLWLQDGRERIEGGLEYATALFERTTAERYVEYLRTLLQAMVANEARVVDRLPLLTQQERHRILYEWNATKAGHERNACAQELFEAQVSRTPEATAVVFDGAVLRYGELNRRANQLAHYLRRLGVKPDERVGICVERGFEMITGLLGVLKAGGAYVPLDPAYPVERLKYMVEESAPTVILTQGSLQPLVTKISETARVVDLCEVRLWQEQPETNPERSGVGLTSQHLAYLIYTSGSTGLPKGVMIPHTALVNFLLSMQQKPGIDARDALLSVTTLSFDIAALELFLPLTVGAQLRILDRQSSADGELLLKELQNGVTMMQATPPTWQMLLDAGWTGTSGLKALCGGEALSSDLAKKLVSRSDSTWNMYGPTETTIWSLTENLEQTQERVTIGRPVENTKVYILDERFEPVPAGVVGEIYIGGEGVARGYWNRPQLTAERFLPDPFVSETDAGERRMYRTGDLGRWLWDGRIECLGRNDFQVKIRGFRIELGEIEKRLAEHPRVRQAIVVARDDKGKTGKRLIAYYTCRARAKGEEPAEGDETRATSGAGEATVAAEQLRKHLASKLPEYMVPTAFVRLESFPLTANGKLDRNFLPAPEGDAFAVRGYEAPQGDLEKELAVVWAEVLQLEKVGRHDNFFELGGHSLLVMRIVARSKALFGSEISVRTLFESPTVRAFAEAIRELTPSELVLQDAQIPRIPREHNLPLSFNQEGRLLVEWWAEMRSAPYAPFHLYEALSLGSEIDVVALEKTLEVLTSRYEILRTSFSDPKTMPVTRLPQEIRVQLDRLNTGEGMTTQEMRDLVNRLLFGKSIFEQTIHPKGTVNLVRIDLENVDPESTDAQLLRIATEAIETPFDYENAPLLRVLLFRKSSAQHLLLIVMPHLLGDGWSLQILRRELTLLYGAFASATPCHLPEIPIQSVDFAAWQRNRLQGAHLEEMLSYWKRRWSEFSLLDVKDLPFAKPSPQVPGYTVETISQTIDQSLSTDLRRLLQERNVTLHMLWLAGLNILLHLYTHKERIGVWGLFANRIQPETENLMGWLSNGHIIGIRVTPEQEIGGLLADVRDVILEGHSYQELPMALLWSHFMKDLDRNPGTGRAPIQPHVSFVADTRADPQPSPLMEQADLPYNTGGLALRLVVVDNRRDIEVFTQYSPDRFRRKSVERMLADWQMIVRTMVDAPSTRVSELAVVLKKDHAIDSEQLIR